MSHGRDWWMLRHTLLLLHGSNRSRGRLQAKEYVRADNEVESSRTARRGLDEVRRE